MRWSAIRPATLTDARFDARIYASQTAMAFNAAKNLDVDEKQEVQSCKKCLDGLIDVSNSRFKPVIEDKPKPCSHARIAALASANEKTTADAVSSNSRSDVERPSDSPCPCAASTPAAKDHGQVPGLRGAAHGRGVGQRAGAHCWRRCGGGQAAWMTAMRTRWWCSAQPRWRSSKEDDCADETLTMPW